MQHQARKRFGQNFLIASNIIDEIIAAINPRAGQRIVEIGPGLGALTYSLIQSQAQVYAVEIDRDLAAHLREKFTAYKNFHLHCHDILKFSLRELFNQQPQQKLRLIGNLPYNISTPLLFKLFSESDIISDMYFMLQREVAERLTAQPNNKQYGRLSITA